MLRPTFNLGPFLETEKLKTDGPNFTTWFRTLRILLTPHRMTYVIEAAISDPPVGTATTDENNVYQTKVDDSRVACSMPWSLTCRNALRR
jgi:hypothetical protein